MTDTEPDELHLSDAARDAVEIALAFVAALMLAICVASPFIA